MYEQNDETTVNIFGEVTFGKSVFNKYIIKVSTILFIYLLIILFFPNQWNERDGDVFTKKQGGAMIFFLRNTIGVN